MHIEKTEDIARAPEEVWAFIADARNDPQWCQKVDSVEQVAGEGPGPGAKYRVLHRPRPRKPPSELKMEVVEYDPPRRLFPIARMMVSRDMARQLASLKRTLEGA